MIEFVHVSVEDNVVIIKIENGNFIEDRSLFIEELINLLKGCRFIDHYTIHRDVSEREYSDDTVCIKFGFKKQDIVFSVVDLIEVWSYTRGVGTNINK